MDIKELAENLGLTEEEYQELIELFVETGISDLEKFQSGINGGNAEEAIEAAHSIKGASGNLGLTDIYEISKEAEQKARHGDLKKASELAQILKEKIGNISELVRHQV